MDLQNYAEKLKIRAKTPKIRGINSYVQEVAKEVCEYVGEPKKFGMWLGIVKRCGPGQVRELLKRMKEKGIKDAKYLMKCTKKN